MDRPQKFIEQAKTLHGDKYDYSKVEYVNTRTPVEIICRTHGSFTKRPNDHLTKKSGCPACGRTHYMTLEIFLDRVKKIYGDLYDCSSVSEYLGYETKHQLICKQHGPFLQTPKSLLIAKQGCQQCGVEKIKQHSKNRRFSQKQFVERAQAIHSDKYDYSKTVYESSGKKIEIICKQHGSFFQTPNAHIGKQKQGCPKCGNKRRGGLGNLSVDLFEKFPEKGIAPAMLYVIEMQAKTDKFIKIGITTRTIKQRFERTGAGAKHVNKTVLYTKYLPLKEAFVLEQHILQQLKQYQYWPNYLKEGRTECLKNCCEVIEQLKHLLK